MRLALVTLALVGCGAQAGSTSPRGEVVSMTLGLRRDRPTLCPRQAVQLAAFADVVEDGAKHRIETGTGRENVNRPGGLDFTDLKFVVSSGRLFRDGWLQPDPDVLASVDRDTTIEATYVPRPEVRAKAVFGVDYACITRAGASARDGHPGEVGKNGAPGVVGRVFGARPAGTNGDGGQGGTGGFGGRGGEGDSGPNLRAYATLVKTRRYDRLVAIWIDGDVSDFVLVHVDAPVTITALGGRGGAGGPGGAGGAGGIGGASNGADGQAGAGGAGGDGGTGGPGGPGGAGGTLELVYDARFPALANQIRLDVSGGAGGEGGPPGRGGQGGFPGADPPPPLPAKGGGFGWMAGPKGAPAPTFQPPAKSLAPPNGLAPSNSTEPAKNRARDDKRGPDGEPGRAGPRGPNGSAGRASSRPGPVALDPTPGLTPL